MANKVKITNEQGAQVFPITHVTAVIDNNGNSVEQVLGAQTDLIQQAQLEIGAVPSDLTPTENSSNWVTSGGVYSALRPENISYDNSQSGIASNNVQGALDELDNRTIVDGNGEPFGIQIPYRVGSNGLWVDGSTATHYLIDVGVGNTVKITSNANQGVRYAWLKNDDAPSNNGEVHWSDIDSGIHVIDVNQSQLATAPTDAGYLYLLRTVSSNNYIPASVVKMESIKASVYEIEWQVKDRTLIDGDTISLGTAYSCIADGGIWKSNGTSEHCLVAVSAGDSYKIESNSSYNADCCWLTSAGTPSSGTVAPFSQIDGTTYIIPIGQTQIITAPEDAAFLCVNTKYNGNVWTPSSVVKMENVNDAIEGLFGIEDGYDFVIRDENKNAIVAFKNGHILTKNFNSENALKGDIRRSDYLIYRSQLDNEFVHNNVGMIGDWVKRTLNNTPVISTYSWGSQLVFKVRGTTSVIGNFVPNSTDTATIGVSVDNGSWSEVNMTSAVTIASGLTTDEHIIRLMSMNPAASSTMYSQGTGCVNFDSLVVDEGAIVTPLTTYNRKILFIGDSITAGASKLNAWKTYSYKLSNMLFSQPVQCCAPSSGLVSSYTSWVPTTMQILRNLLDGYINYINEPDIIFINVGTNDSTTGGSFTTAYSNMLTYLRNRFGGCYIFACSPFDGTHLSDTSAAIEGFDNITWIDTTELAGNYSTSDGVHPDDAGALTCAEFCYDKITEIIDLNYFN